MTPLAPLFLALASAVPQTPSEPSQRLAWGDLDRDGRPDLAAVRGGELRLFAQRGDGSLADVTAGAGLAQLADVRVALWHDLDGDGTLDLALGTGAGLRLFAGDGRGGFSDVTEASGLALPAGAVERVAFDDFDRDGRSDLHVNVAGGDELARSLGGGRFERVDLGWPEIAAPVARPAQPAARVPADDSAAATLGASVGGANAAGSRAAAAALGLCAASIGDALLGGCMTASAVPALGSLMPLSIDFNVDPAGNVGMGTTTPGAKLDVVGDVRANGKLVSSAISGAPLAVFSNELVANLNADRLDGLDASAFSQLGSSIEGAEVLDGTLTDVDLAPDAAIAGSKVLPDFGGQDLLSQGVISVLGLRTQAGSTPAVIGGFAGNTTGANVGATIAGGGQSNGAENTVFGDFGAVSGGSANHAGPRAVVAGGQQNSASGTHSVIGGGSANVASETISTVVGGSNNRAQGAGATVVGGFGSRADGQYSLACGNSAMALHDNAFVWNSKFGSFSSTAPEQFLVTAAGGVGINTNDPRGELHVLRDGSSLAPIDPDSVVVAESNGASFLSIAAPSSQARGLLFPSQSNARAGALRFYESLSTLELSVFADQGRLSLNDQGRVGINTLDPEAPLHVFFGSAGSGVTANVNSMAVFERSNGGFVSILGPDGSSKGILFGRASDVNSGGIVYDQASVANESMQFRTGGNSTKMTITSVGKVGIGTTAPAFDLHVNGSAGKPGGGSWSVASDARLKRDVEPLAGALERLLALRGVTYEYIDPGSIEELPGLQTGFIAQEVEQIFPGWVEQGADGYRRLSIRGFEALAVEALRELEQSQRRELQALNAANHELLERLERLEADADQSGACCSARVSVFR